MENVERSMMNRFIEIEDEMLIPLVQQLKGVFPDRFFVVEEGFQHGEKVFSRLRFMSESRDEALAWINIYKDMIVSQETGIFRAARGERTEERFWTAVFDHVKVRRGTKRLGKRGIISGAFFCLAEMTPSKLAMRAFDQF